MNDETKILLVDDEPLVLRSMEKTLVRSGFDVVPARDAQSALQTFQGAQEADEPFDVAIVDLHMPNLEGQDDPNAGLELLSALLERDPALRVVVLTAFDEVGRAKEAVSRGAQAYFVKGREAGLVELVDRLVQV